MHDRNFLHKLFGAVHLTGSISRVRTRNTDPQLANQNAPFCRRTRAPYNRDFKQIATASSTTAVMTEEVWGEQVAVAR